MAVSTEQIHFLSPQIMTKKKLTATCSYDGNAHISVHIMNDPVTHLDEGYLSCGSEGKPEANGKKLNIAKLLSLFQVKPLA